MKEKIEILVCMLVFATAILPVAGTMNNVGIITKEPIRFNSDSILYVGGNGPNNYTRIQDAIDNASNGYTIFVYNGLYCENILIDKTINLMGEDRNNTIIDGGKRDNVVGILVDAVNISGFTIQNSSRQGNYDAGININSDCNKVSCNTIYYNLYGINISETSTNNIISDNDIIRDGYGIYAAGCNNLITNNTLMDNMYAIEIFGNNNMISYNIIKSNGNNNMISYNIIKNNFDGFGIGIALVSANNNTILLNTIQRNSFQNIKLWRASNNKIIKNNIIEVLYPRTTKFSATNFSQCKNKWSQNYWNRPRFLPKPILGRWQLEGLDSQESIFWFNFDWRPAKKPYSIK